MKLQEEKQNLKIERDDLQMRLTKSQKDSELALSKSQVLDQENDMEKKKLI